jgi:hypothetical protein
MILRRKRGRARAIFVLIILMSCSFHVTSPALAYDPVDCAQDAARADREIVVGLVTELCSGASSPAVVQCYANAFKVDSGMPRGLAINLCAGSTNATTTLNCYVKAGRMGMARGIAIDLCGARRR